MNRLIPVLISLLLSCILVVADAPQNWEKVEVIGRGNINDVVWLPDGRLAVFGIRGIWVYVDISASAEPDLVESPYGAIRSAAISGSVLATGHGDGSVTIWNAQGLTEEAHFAALDSAISSIDLSADGTKVAVGSSQIGVQVWDVPTQTRILDVPMQSIIDDLALSPDGGWLYILTRLTFAQTNDLGNPSQLDIIDVTQPQHEQIIDDVGSDSVEHLSVSADGRWIALAGGQGLSIWDSQKKELIRTFYPASYASIPFFTDHGLYLYQDSMFSILTSETWTEDTVINFAEPFIAGNAAFSDRWIALVGAEGQNNETLRLIKRDDDTFFDLPFDGPVYSIDINDEQVIADYKRPDPRNVTSPDGRWNAFWRTGEGIYLQDTLANSQKLLDLPTTIDSTSAIIQSRFSPDSKQLAVAIVPEPGVLVWDVETATLALNYQVDRFEDLTWRNNDFGIASSKGLALWTDFNWKARHQITAPEGYNNLLHPRLILGTQQVIVWDNSGSDMSSGECIGCAGMEVGFVFYTGHKDDKNLQERLESDAFTALDVALSPDESYIAVGDSSGRIHFISLESGQESGLLNTEAGAINVLRFDAQGRLISGHESGIVQIWK